MRYLIASQKFTTCAAIAVSLVLTSAAAAQTTGSGLFGSRTVGGSSGLTAGNRTNLGATSALGAGGSGIAGATQQETDTGTITGDERFTREGAQGAFVGADSADMASVFGTALNNQFQALQLNNNQQNLNVNSGGQQATSFRVRYNVGFLAPTIPSMAIQGALDHRFLDARLGVPANSTVTARVEGSRVILEGKVPTQADRKLIVRMAQLEPGVWAVDDRLLVESADSAAGQSNSSAGSSNLLNPPPQIQGTTPPAGAPAAAVPGGLVPTFSRGRSSR